MILKASLKEIVKSQKEELLINEGFIERDELKNISFEIQFAIIISGIRRCGKSTLLKQLIKKTNKFHYFNFEDPRAINFEIEDFKKLEEIFNEENDSKYYFFDEIQNVNKWEILVRSLLDKKNYIVITGSNASLLSKELGTKLTGRHLRHELFPFSYNEFLKLTKEKRGIESFEKYFTNGGFPEYLINKKSQILQELLNDIISRDIVTRHKLRNIKTVKEMALYLLTNSGKEFSYNSLRKMFGLGSTNSVISFVSYFEDSYLLFTIPKFDYSLKKQLVNQKKVYSIDNGFSYANSLSFSEDKGKMLENLVFINLRKSNREIFYFQEKGECDFIVKEKNRITKAIQVCYNLNEDNKKREISGIAEALVKFNLDEGAILTFNQEDVLKVDGKIIRLIPVWKWV